MSKSAHYTDQERAAKAVKIRRGIRSAQLRVVLDRELGRETPKAIIRLAELKLPKLPVNGDVREAKEREIRDGIRAAQLRVALDKARGRETPQAVVRLANLEFPRRPSLRNKD